MKYYIIGLIPATLTDLLSEVESMEKNNKMMIEERLKSFTPEELGQFGLLLDAVESGKDDILIGFIRGLTEEEARKFREVFSLLSDCHRGYPFRSPLYPLHQHDPYEKQPAAVNDLS